MEVVLPGEADAAVDLDRGVGDAPAGVARRRPWPSRPPAAATPARRRRPRRRRRRPSARSRSPAASARSGGRPPGRRRSGARTAGGLWRSRPPSPASAGRSRSTRRRARRRRGGRRRRSRRRRRAGSPPAATRTPSKRTEESRRVGSIAISGVTVTPSAPRLDEVAAAVGGGDEEEVGAGGVQAPGSSRRRGRPRRRRPSASIVKAPGRAGRAGVPERRRAAQLPLGQRPQVALALLVGAASAQRQADDGVGEERRGRERVAHLLEEHGQLDDPEALAAPLLGQRQPGPAELGHLPPAGGVGAVVAGGDLPHPLRFEAGGEEVVGGLLDRLLLVGEVEVHGVRSYRILGRPSTRSAMMFLRMSVVPPSIELARERRKPYCQAPLAIACSEPRASGA